MSFFANIGLWLKWRRVMGEIEHEQTSGYDVRKTLAKGALSLAVTGGSVALAAFAAWLTDSDAVTAALVAGGVSLKLVGVLVPLLTAVARMLLNYLKHGTGSDGH